MSQQQSSTVPSTCSTPASASSASSMEQLRGDLHRLVDQAVDRLKDNLSAQRDAEIDRLTRCNSRLAALLSHERSVTKHQAQQLRILRDTSNHHGNDAEPATVAALLPTARKRRKCDLSDSSMSMAKTSVAQTAAGAARRDVSVQRHKRRRTQPAAVPSSVDDKKFVAAVISRRSSRRSTAAYSSTSSMEEPEDESTLTDAEDIVGNYSATELDNESSSACNRLGIQLSPPSRLLAPPKPAKAIGGRRHSAKAVIVNHRDDLLLNTTGASVVTIPAKKQQQQQQQQKQPVSSAGSSNLSMSSSIAADNTSQLNDAVGNFQQLDSTTVMPVHDKRSTRRQSSSSGGAAANAGLDENRPKLGGSPTHTVSRKQQQQQQQQKQPVFKPPLPPARFGPSVNKKVSSSSSAAATATATSSMPTATASTAAMLSPLYCSTLRVNSRDFDPESDKPIPTKPPVPSARKRESANASGGNNGLVTTAS